MYTKGAKRGAPHLVSGRSITLAAVVAAPVLSLVWAAGGSASGSPSRIMVKVPQGGFELPQIPPTRTSRGTPLRKIIPASPSNHPLTFSLKGNVSCGSKRNGSATTCQVLGSMVARQLGPLSNVPLATFSRTLQTGASLSVVFALSQHSVNLLYQHGDPRCTVVLSVVTDGGSPVAKTWDNVPISFVSPKAPRRARG